MTAATPAMGVRVSTGERAGAAMRPRGDARAG